MKIALTVLLAFVFFCSCYEELEKQKYDHTIPVVKLKIDEKHLWAPDSGLYVVGNNGVSFFYSQVAANYNQKWEFPARVEYYENNKLIFRHNVGFRIKGRGSRKNPMKTIGLYWRGSYGRSTLKYPIFPDNETDTFKRLLLRNSGNDFGSTHIKDATIAMVHKDFSRVDFQDYKPCVLYLNGEYWGIHNIREMITPRYFMYKYGVDHNQVDLLEGCELSPYVDDGSAADYLADVVEFLNNNNLSDNYNYNEFAKRIDIESYIDYIIIHSYIANTDWPMRNARWWREKSTPGFTKWKWVVYDGDYAFRPENIDKVWIGNLYGEVYNPDLANGFFIFNKLIENPGFVEEFLERYLFFIDVVFAKERFDEITRINRNYIEPEYEMHRRKWRLMSKQRWINEIDEMIEMNNIRNDMMRKIINELQHEFH